MLNEMCTVWHNLLIYIWKSTGPAQMSSVKVVKFSVQFRYNYGKVFFSVITIIPAVIVYSINHRYIIWNYRNINSNLSNLKIFLIQRLKNIAKQTIKIKLLIA